MPVTVKVNSNEKVRDLLHFGLNSIVQILAVAIALQAHIAPTRNILGAPDPRKHAEEPRTSPIDGTGRERPCTTLTDRIEQGSCSDTARLCQP